jgi:hypothetical protein
MSESRLWKIVVLLKKDDEEKLLINFYAQKVAVEHF